MKLQIFLVFTAVLGMDIPGLTVPTAYKNLGVPDKSGESSSTKSASTTSSTSTSTPTPGSRITNEKGGNEIKNTDPKPSSSGPISTEPTSKPITEPSSKPSPTSSSTAASGRREGVSISITTSDRPRPTTTIPVADQPRESINPGPSSAIPPRCRLVQNSGGRIVGISQRATNDPSISGLVVIECIDAQGRVVRTTSADGRLAGSTGSGIINGIPITGGQQGGNEITQGQSGGGLGSIQVKG